MEIDDETNSFNPCGSPVEVALLNFMVDNDEPVQLRLEEREKDFKLYSCIPFSSYRRMMTVAYQIPNTDIVRVVVKGAPEEIIPRCTQELDRDNETRQFSEDDHANLLEGVISNKIAKQGMKPLSIAYRDFEVNQFEQLKSENNNFEDDNSRIMIETDLILAASFGLEDPLREDSKEVVHSLFEANVNTRILSGDHRDCVLKVARELDVIKQQHSKD